MPRGLPQLVKEHIEKCRSSAIAAVDAYNRPGPRFRTAQFIILIIIAWTAVLHAIFYRRGRRPWFRRQAAGVGRYARQGNESWASNNRQSKGRSLHAQVHRARQAAPATGLRQVSSPRPQCWCSCWASRS